MRKSEKFSPVHRNTSSTSRASKKTISDRVQDALKDTEIIPRDYVFKKWIFWTVLILLCVGWIAIAKTYGLEEKYYFACPDEKISCQNPYFMTGKTCPPGFPCDQEVLPPGFVFGSPPPPVLQNAGFYALFLVLIGLFANHFLYNWKRFKKW